MLNEKKLLQLKEDLQPLLPLLKKAANSIKEEEISNYPIFIIYKGGEEIGLGLPLLAEQEMMGKWSVNASTLEELATKKIVAMENVERFCDVYKTHPAAACLFVWEATNAQFVYLPL